MQFGMVINGILEVISLNLLSLANEDSMMSSIMFSGYVSTNPEVRKASAEAMAQLSAWGIELSTREDLFKGNYLLKSNLNKSCSISTNFKEHQQGIFDSG